MALKRSGNRFEASIWPGFVDAMTALLLILFFVLSIFMIVQFALRETITGQGRELDSLTLQLTDLADALGLERSRAAVLATDLDGAQERIATQLATIGLLTDQTEAQGEQIVAFEAQIAGLLLDKEALETANATTLSQKEAVELALAAARDEISEGEENARLAAAKRDALEALIKDLQATGEIQVAQITETQAALSEAEKAQLAEAAAAAALRERLENADAELTAMSLSLEAQRKEAEDTLTLLAAAKAAQKALTLNLDTNLSETERQAALAAQANELLAQEQALSADSQRKVALLNAQTEELRKQLSQLQGLLDASNAADTESKIQLEILGSNLNAALARVAAEQRKRAQLEEQERIRLEAEAKDLKKFRSEFFGRLRDVLEGQEGVRIVGDRFVFSSEVLFGLGSAELGARGRNEIAKVAGIINQLADQIPDEIDWILRVDGHTDRIPLSSQNNFKDNWELSQARALSVVRYLINDLGIPANRLAANGFGEFQPIDTGNTPAAYATNRRIELKFTEK
jgi:chemotaxis protein MotB